MSVSNFVPVADARVRRRMNWTWRAGAQPCRQGPVQGSSDRSRTLRSACRPRFQRALDLPVHDHAGADPSKVFDQREPQHDRDRPQLAQAQGGDALVGSHEAAQAVGVEASVAVRNRTQCNVVDPRESARRTSRSGAAVRGCSLQASAAGRAPSALRSGTRCRAATRPQASDGAGPGPPPRASRLRVRERVDCPEAGPAGGRAPVSG